MPPGDDGTWTLTVGPLALGIYNYTFEVGGVSAPDPRNRLRSASPPHSIVEVKGETLSLSDPDAFEHAEVHMHWHDSPDCGCQSLAVYVPLGYEEGKAEHPVFCLLNGVGERRIDWISDGRLNVIADNLAALQQAEPMIIVMPQKNPLDSGNPGEDFQAFDRYFSREVIPFAEHRYRIRSGRESRAIAGKSMGVYLRSTFGWIGLGSSVA